MTTRDKVRTALAHNYNHARGVVVPCVRAQAVEELTRLVATFLGATRTYVDAMKSGPLSLVAETQVFAAAAELELREAIAPLGDHDKSLHRLVEWFREQP